MEKLNLSKLYKAYYSAKTKPEVIELEPAPYLAIRGKGDPNEADYANHLGALYSVAYTLKFACKEKGQDFVVPKLEGQWWFDEQKFGTPSMETAPTAVPRREWEYRMLLRVPDFVTEQEVHSAIDSAFAKKQNECIRQVGYFTLEEGLCIQILHQGPYANEPESLNKLLELIKEKNYLKNGHHHEIYLNDPRKTAPEKLKTILREPVKELAASNH